MTEVFPRFGLPPVNFLETDPVKIESEIITDYENAAGRTLAAGDPIRLFLLNQAAREIQLRNLVNIAAQQNLLSYAQGTFLDHLGEYLSTKRLAESYAKTTIRFTLAQALANVYHIPAGFEVTNGIVTFAIDEELEIPIGSLSGEVTATCTTSGTAGNDYFVGQITTIVTPMTFLAKAENITMTSGGADAENDAEYAERIHQAPNRFSTAGTKKGYEFFASSVSSAIIDVSVDSPNPGEVNVYPLLSDGELPSQEILEQIETYLSSEDIRPMTDFVQVMTPAVYEYEITVHYWISAEDKTRTLSIQTAVEAAVEDYRLWQQSKIGRDIAPARLIANVINAGAARIEASTMTPSSFVELGPNTVAQCKKVTVVYEGYKSE